MTLRLHRLPPVAASVAAVVVVGLGWYAFELGAVDDQSRLTIALLTGVFLGLVTPAVVAMWRRPTDRWPPLLAIAAVCFTASYYRYLQPPLIAAIGTFVWYASVPLVLAALTGTARAPAVRALRPWLLATTGLAVVGVVTSGPTSAIVADPSLRATSWSYFDGPAGRWVHQRNPFGWWATDSVAWTVWSAWSITIAAAAVWCFRAAHPAWRWGGAIAVGASIVLGLPQRSGPDQLIARSFGDLLTSTPVIAVGAAAAWVVWREMIIPRLDRPAATVLRLDPTTSGDMLRRRLVRIVGDPSADVVFHTEGQWITADGRPVPADAPPGRHRWRLERAGSPIAAIDLDASSVDTPDLVEFAAAALAPSVEAQRLAAVAAAHAATTQGVAAEILEAERAAQQEMYQLITDGPDATLAGLLRRLDDRPLPLGAIHDGLRRSLEQVRSIARRTERRTTPPSEATT